MLYTKLIWQHSNSVGIKQSGYLLLNTTYFSNYFKRHFKSAYQKYLDAYRMALVKKRLAIGGLKMKEIAGEFGFTDASHLSKTFKKVAGKIPREFSG